MCTHVHICTCVHIHARYSLSSGQISSIIRAASKDGANCGGRAMRDGCNFRSRRVGRSVAIKADYRNYRCPISDVCLLLTLPLTSYADQKSPWRALACLICPGYKHVNGTTINHFSVLGPARQMDCPPPRGRKHGKCVIFLWLVSNGSKASSKLFVVALCKIIPLFSLRTYFAFTTMQDFQLLAFRIFFLSFRFNFVVSLNHGEGWGLSQYQNYQGPWKL